MSIDQVWLKVNLTSWVRVTGEDCFSGDFESDLDCLEVDGEGPRGLTTSDIIGEEEEEEELLVELLGE